MMMFKFSFLGVVTALCMGCVAADGYVDAQVLIVGGGPAGIQAAATLLENNITNFLILEEDSQLRGYLAPVDFAGFTFAPGSVWGFPPILDTLNERNIAYKESDYESIIIRNDAGEDVTTEALARQEDMFDALDEGIDQIAEDIDKGVRPDVSEKVALARGGWTAATAIDKVMEWFDFDFIDGISAQDISTIGRYRQRDLFNTSEYFILDDVTLAGPLLGDQEAMLEEGDYVRYGQRAVLIDNAADSVRVTTEDGTQFTGEYVIVTSTVGVLQHGGVTFNPPLPPWKTEEICRFQMGTIDPIFMKFASKFWDDAEWILHASDRHGYYPAFMNLEADGLKPAGTNILIGFITGDEAYRAELLTDDEVQAEIIEVLRGMYGAENVPEPTEFYMSRFATDPSLYGSFTTWPIGDIPEDAQMRLQAHEGRVYFALEDASADHITIPFGSVEAGKTAARGVALCIQEMYCGGYTPVGPKVPPLCSDVKSYNPTKFRKDFNVGRDPIMGRKSARTGVAGF